MNAKIFRTSGLRRAAVAGIAGGLAVCIVFAATTAANAVIADADGSLPLELVEGSRLLGVEQYNDHIYDLSAGSLNTTRETASSSPVQTNHGATFDPESGLVYFLTGRFSGCALNSFDPQTSEQSVVASLVIGATPMTGCWGLTTMGGGTALLAAGSTLYDIDLSTGAISSPRETPCPGSSMAFDPSTGTLYSGTNGGQLYRVDDTGLNATCTLLTTLTDVVDNTTENLKGFTFDTDGTLYLLSRWAPKLFSLNPADLASPTTSYGDIRFTPQDEPLPIDSLAMIYAPLPETIGESGSSAQLPSTGADMVGLAAFATVLCGAGVFLGLARKLRRTG